jgi:hypothetical protein
MDVTAPRRRVGRPRKEPTVVVHLRVPVRIFDPFARRSVCGGIPVRHLMVRALEQQVAADARLRKTGA